MISNPFTFLPVPPTKFAGRERELCEIMGMLARTSPNNIAIVGARRIGKTSLLRYLVSKEAQVRYPGGLENKRVLYINCESLGPYTPHDFWQLGETEDVTLRQKLVDASVEERDLLRRLDEWTDGTPRKPILLLLDEFELMVRHPAFRDFFPFLRSILQNPRYMLSLITMTATPLYTIASLDDTKSSPIFNIFSSLSLGRFYDNDYVRELIEKTLTGTEIAFSSDEYDLACALSERHPYHAQVAGRLIVDGQNKGLQGSGLIEWVQNEFLSSNGEAFQHTQYLLKKLTPRELEAIKLARRNRYALSSYQRQLLRDLDGRGALPIGIQYEA